MQWKEEYTDRILYLEGQGAESRLRDYTAENWM